MGEHAEHGYTSACPGGARHLARNMRSAANERAEHVGRPWDPMHIAVPMGCKCTAQCRCCARPYQATCRLQTGSIACDQTPTQQRDKAEVAGHPNFWCGPLLELVVAVPEVLLKHGPGHHVAAQGTRSVLSTLVLRCGDCTASHRKPPRASRASSRQVGHLDGWVEPERSMNLTACEYQ